MVAAFAGWIYQVDPDLCTGCGFCIYWCPEGAITLEGPDARIDPLLCNGCGLCVTHCPWSAIYRVWWEGVEPPPEGSGPAISPDPSPGTVFVSGIPDGAVVLAMDVSGRKVAFAVSEGGTAVLDLGGSCPGVYLLVGGDGTPLGKVSVTGP